MAKGANNAPSNSLFCFFISCFTVSVNPSINTPKYFNDLMILISFISPFEINKVNSFPALTDAFPLIFFSNLIIAFGVKLLTDPDILSIAKGIAILVLSFLNYLNKKKKIHLIELF